MTSIDIFYTNPQKSHETVLFPLKFPDSLFFLIFFLKHFLSIQTEQKNT